jgi:hypothetical protein
MSQDPHDMLDRTLLSSCCGAPMFLGDLCSKCKEHADGIPAEQEDPSEQFICERCGGEGWIDYLDGDGTDWGEDCPSEINHPIRCRICNGRGRVK